MIEMKDLFFWVLYLCDIRLYFLYYYYFFPFLYFVLLLVLCMFVCLDPSILLFISMFVSPPLIIWLSFHIIECD